MPGKNGGSSCRWTLPVPEHVIGGTFDVLPKNVENPKHGGAKS
jgi:hypothetical protein